MLNPNNNNDDKREQYFYLGRDGVNFGHLVVFVFFLFTA